MTIRPDSFVWMRAEIAQWSARQTAAFFDVTLKTVHRWETGRSPVPVMAYRCLCTWGAGFLPTEARSWQDWRILNGRLIPPGSGYALDAGEIAAIPLLYAQIAELRRLLRMENQPASVPACFADVSPVLTTKRGNA